MKMGGFDRKMGIFTMKWAIKMGVYRVFYYENGAFGYKNVKNRQQRNNSFKYKKSPISIKIHLKTPISYAKSPISYVKSPFSM
jgi:hypothetical protein